MVTWVVFYLCFPCRQRRCGGGGAGPPAEPALCGSGQRSVSAGTVLPHQRGPGSCQLPAILPAHTIHTQVSMHTQVNTHTQYILNLQTQEGVHPGKCSTDTKGGVIFGCMSDLLFRVRLLALGTTVTFWWNDSNCWNERQRRCETKWDGQMCRSDGTFSQVSASLLDYSRRRNVRLEDESSLCETSE